jgi:hypothetical protein
VNLCCIIFLYRVLAPFVHGTLLVIIRRGHSPTIYIIGVLLGTATDNLSL